MTVVLSYLMLKTWQLFTTAAVGREGGGRGEGGMQDFVGWREGPLEYIVPTYTCIQYLLSRASELQCVQFRWVWLLRVILHPQEE